MKRRAVVLLSGGLDSATTLYLAKKRGYRCDCLTFDYGQRHRREIGSAKKIARMAGARCRVVPLSFSWKGSSLLDRRVKIPAGLGRRRGRRPGIPSTYVPARNIVFLSLALSHAESIGASAVFIGANAVDFSGYPDCRGEFYRAFRKAASLGTKAGVEGRGVKILTPLIHKTKAEIVRMALALGVPLRHTWSCYRGARRPCGRCDSCSFRAKGFREAGLKDPLIYGES